MGYWAILLFLNISLLTYALGPACIRLAKIALDGTIAIISNTNDDFMMHGRYKLI